MDEEEVVEKVLDVAVEDNDGVGAGEVRPPQVQAPFVPRGICKEPLISHCPNDVITFLHYSSSISRVTRLLENSAPTEVSEKKMQRYKTKM